jgi:hypothetical protein
MGQFSELIKSFGAPPLVGSQPGFGLRGWVGEDAYLAIVAECDNDFPIGWDERDALI